MPPSDRAARTFSASSTSTTDSEPANQAETLHSSTDVAAAVGDPSLRSPVPGRQLLPLLLASFTLFVAYIAPLSFSLAVRIESLDPASKDAMLPLAVGIPGMLILIASPLTGVLSDRTRSRFGRRRPWMLGGAILALTGAVFVGVTPSVIGVVVGWCVAYVGYSTCAGMISAHFGDRLPASQRGKVMGINGAMNNIAPVFGTAIAAAFTSQQLSMFLVPGAVAFVGSLVFIAFAKDPQLTDEVPRLDLKALGNGFYFNPRKYPDLGWVWLSRAMIFVGVSFLTLYTVYLLTSRLDMTSAEVGALVATLGLPGVACAIIGAIGSGWLSDKLSARKPFLAASALMLAVSLVLIGTTQSLAQYIVAMLLGNLAIGIYSAVDQAIALDTIPHEENQNGRYLSIFGLASAVPQAIGPFLAGLILAVSGGYGGVYVVGGVFAVIGAIAILPVRATIRTEASAQPSHPAA